MSSGTFQNVSVTDTTSSNNISCNNLVCNNTALMTGFSSPTLTTNSISSSSSLSITAPTITIGDNTSNVTIQGNTTYANVTNLDVKDPLIRLNKSGINAIGSGIEIEENGSIISSLKLDSSKDFTIISPNNKLTAGNIVTGSLNTTGNTTIGDSPTDTLTVNSTSTFQSGLSVSSGNTTIGPLSCGNISSTGDITSGNGKNIYANSTTGTTKFCIFPYETDNTIYFQSGNGTVGTSSNMFWGNSKSLFFNSLFIIVFKSFQNMVRFKTISFHTIFK
jgi:hypothetical protein